MFLVLGATGGFGGAVVRELARRGLPVRAMVRDPGAAKLPAGVEVVKGDAHVMPELLHAAKGADVIVHGLGAPMHRWEPDLVVLHQNVVEASGLTGAAVVFLQSLNGVKPVPGVPLPADALLIDPFDKLGRLTRVRAEMEQLLEQNSELRNVRAVVIRAADLIGPGLRRGIGAETEAAVKAGHPAPWYGSAGHAFSHVEEVARLAVALAMLEGRPPFEVVNAPTHVFIEAGDWAKALSEAVGRTVTLRSTPPWLLQLRALWSAEARALVQAMPMWQGPIILDDSRTRALLPDLPPLDVHGALREWLGGAKG